MNIYLKCCVFCTLLTLASSVKLIQSTLKPRHTKYSSSTPFPASESLATPPNEQVTPAKGIVQYRAKAKNGATCILLKTDGLIEVKFKSDAEDQTGDTYMPAEIYRIEENCRDGDTASMTISWNGYSLLWEFAKTPGGERWYIDKLQLTVSTNLAIYQNVRNYGDTFELVHDQMLFPTPVGKSFACEESIVQLIPSRPENSPPGLHGTLFLRAFQLQPFMYKGSNFGPPFECNAQLGFRDETAPVAVGSTLAIAVLMTVTGYGIFRYFKIKKVQYNTME